MDININQKYAGRFESLSTTKAGTTKFYAAQKVTSQISDSEIEMTTINWSVDKDGKLKGKATFFSTVTPDKIDAELTGTSPSPSKGQNYREANVKVNFVGGTGAYKGASGTAEVKAKLFNDGTSSGNISGSVAVSEKGAAKLQALKPK